MEYFGGLSNFEFCLILSLYSFSQSAFEEVFCIFFFYCVCFVFPFISAKVIDFLRTPYLKWSTLLFSYLCSALYWLVSFLDSPKGQITISVQTFPDNKNRRVKWCYKTRNRTKLKIYQRKTSTNPFFSQGIVFDHRSADLKKKKRNRKTNLWHSQPLHLSRSTLKWVSQMFVLFFLQSIVTFHSLPSSFFFVCFLSNLAFLHLKLIFWGVLPSLNIFSGRNKRLLYLNARS